MKFTILVYTAVESSARCCVNLPAIHLFPELCCLAETPNPLGSNTSCISPVWRLASAGWYRPGAPVNGKHLAPALSSKVTSLLSGLLRFRAVRAGPGMSQQLARLTAAVAGGCKGTEGCLSHQRGPSVNHDAYFIGSSFSIAAIVLSTYLKSHE